MMDGGLCMTVVGVSVYYYVLHLSMHRGRPFEKADGGVPFIRLFTAIAAVIYRRRP